MTGFRRVLFRSDALLENLELAQKKTTLSNSMVFPPNKKVILLTIHRPSNVDTKLVLEAIMSSFLTLNSAIIIFPIHPRTKKKLEEFNIIEKINQKSHIRLLEPLSYFDMIYLMQKAYFFITDSGGLQEEAVILNKPCITLRENTERPETIETGSNILVGNDPEKISHYINRLLDNGDFYKSKLPKFNPFGDGKTSKRIIQIIKDSFHKDCLKIPSITFENRIPTCKLVKIDETTIDITNFQTKNRCVVLEVYDQNGYAKVPHTQLVLEEGWMVKIRLF